MRDKFLKPYNPQETEARIYKLWEKGGYFNPDNLPERHKESFSIILPPPNVTGVLHLGSALMLAIEDIMVRFERMRGKKTLWIPGTDHAAIATETKFLKERKISRNDYSREEFVRMVNEYALENQKTIIEQMRAMGASLDWSRQAFTLDNDRKRAVEEAFMRMNDAELIYAGEYLVNWDLKGQTTVSDDEIEYELEEGTLYKFKYSSEFPITIATTLPETKLGDAAVAVHPDDERYKKYIGKSYRVTFMGAGLDIKVIADESVDPEFGTGAVGITPAHSKKDYDMAVRHRLMTKGQKFNQVINEHGRIINSNRSVNGLKIKEAREKILQWLSDNKLLEGQEKIAHEVPKAQRSGGAIITLPKRHQFFINVNKPIAERGNKTLKELMRGPIMERRIKILPERFEKVYLQWIDNLRDWNISRQIWYGHPIPNAWYKDNETLISIKKPGSGWERIEDTLDTWFSSGLWTFSTLGWPEQTKDLETYHPTSVLETGYDILFFWIARMILMSQFHMGEIPFKTAYLHGLVRDEKNRKISKSLGNNIDPLEVIKSYGADALRMAMIVGTSVGNDSKVSMDKFKGYKNFANKLWNIARYVMSQNPPVGGPEELKKELIEEFDALAKDVTVDMENYRFYLAAEKIYHYIWHRFADQILEESKSKPELLSTIYYLLENSLKLLHPFMPFITEEIWSELKKNNLLMIEPWPVR